MMQPLTIEHTEATLPFNEESAHILGKAFWKMMELYHLPRRAQAILLGVNPNNRKTLLSYEKQKIIPLDPDKFLRVSFLLGIHKNLRILYPNNVAYNWMTTHLEVFHGQTPVHFITQNEAQSLLRLATVRRFLDIHRTSH